MTSIRSNKDKAANYRAEQLRLQILENHDLMMSKPFPGRLSTAIRVVICEAHKSEHKILDMQGILHKILLERPHLVGRYLTSKKFHMSMELYYTDLYVVLNKLVDEFPELPRPFRHPNEVLKTPVDQRLLGEILSLDPVQRGQSLCRLFEQPPFQISVENYNTIQEEASKVQIKQEIDTKACDGSTSTDEAHEDNETSEVDAGEDEPKDGRDDHRSEIDTDGDEKAEHTRSLAGQQDEGHNGDDSIKESTVSASSGIAELDETSSQSTDNTRSSLSEGTQNVAMETLQSSDLGISKNGKRARSTCSEEDEPSNILKRARSESF